MSRRHIAAAALAVALAALAVGTARASAPPAGLTANGQRVWNLDALLHDQFGARPVYLRTWGAYPPPWGHSVHRSWDFGTVSLSNCCSGYWNFTFASARHSAFTLRRPAVAPPPDLGASGGEMPLTIDGRYISCSFGTWLYIHLGNGPANTQFDCSGG